MDSTVNPGLGKIVSPNSTAESTVFPPLASILGYYDIFPDEVFSF